MKKYNTWLHRRPGVVLVIDLATIMVSLVNIVASVILYDSPAIALFNLGILIYAVLDGYTRVILLAIKEDMNQKYGPMGHYWDTDSTYPHDPSVKSEDKKDE